MTADQFKLVPVVVVEDAASPVGVLGAAEQLARGLGLGLGLGLVLLPPQESRKVAPTMPNSTKPRTL